MKKILLLLLIGILISGCSEKEEPVEPSTVHIEKRSDGLAYDTGKTVPFSGIFEGYYRNGYKKAEIHFKNGKQEGAAKTWYENGQLHNDASFRDGKLDGVATEWRRDGTKNTDRLFKEGKLIGSMK